MGDFFQILDENDLIMAQRTTEKAIIKDAMDFKRVGRKFKRVVKGKY